MEMPIIFSDEDLMYIDKERDNQLQSLRQEIDTLKTKGDASFCKKCGHIMQGFALWRQYTVGKKHHYLSREK